MREFRRASDEFRATIETNLQIHEDHASASSTYAPVATTSTPSEAGEAPGGEGSAGGAASMESTAEAAPVGSAAYPGGEDGAKPAGEPVEPFWTARGGRLLHRSACTWRSRVPEADRVPLKAATDGWDLGLLPCPVCDPRAAEVAS
jgi:hypothetical protein